LPLPPLAHKRRERGVRSHGEAFENKCKQKPKAKSQEGATMVKRFVRNSCTPSPLRYALTKKTVENGTIM